MSKINNDILSLLSFIKSLETYYEYEVIADYDKNKNNELKKYSFNLILKDQNKFDKINNTIH